MRPACSIASYSYAMKMDELFKRCMQDAADKQAKWEKTQKILYSRAKD